MNLLLKEHISYMTAQKHKNYDGLLANLLQINSNDKNFRYVNIFQF